MVEKTDASVGQTESLPHEGSELFNQNGDKVAIWGSPLPASRGVDPMPPAVTKKKGNPE
jgi:hypothetical protein